MFHTNKYYHHIFDKVNLNVDSYIKVVYPTNPNNLTYLIDDVYNPAYGKGGKLKSSTIGLYTNLNGYETNERLNKYFLRKDLTGVQFNSAIVVKLYVENTF